MIIDHVVKVFLNTMPGYFHPGGFAHGKSLWLRMWLPGGGGY